jgi:Fe-S oxidoreductase
MNPGKIVAPPKMDQRESFRFDPGYATIPLRTALDWTDFEVGAHNRGRGFAAALEMCNNNGHCRKFDAGTMCPSYRVTRNERDLTRGRANSLRLAMSGQLGGDALTSDAMYETMSLCVSCKGCKRECPTGVDMARMKIEFLHQYHKKQPRSIKDKLVAHLPRYAPWASALAPLMNMRNWLPGAAKLTEAATGIAARRRLPHWRWQRFRGQSETPGAPVGAPEVVLLADTFNTYFEPENLRAAVEVLSRAGYRVHIAEPADGGRPLCCGRTYLAAGMVEHARVEAGRLIQALKPFIDNSIAIVGLEPSCLFGLKDELPSLLGSVEAKAVAELAVTFEDFIVSEQRAGRLKLEFEPLDVDRVLVHGHCHQKAFDAMSNVHAALRLVPGLDVQTIQSSCCGMAGAFGYDARYFETSMQMAEVSLLPAVRAADASTLLVADGTSCRHQIRDGADREAVHVARVLAKACRRDS